MKLTRTPFAAAACMAAFFVAGCAAPDPAPVPEPPAEQACLPTGEMYSHLRARYGEEAIWLGQSTAGLAVLFLSGSGSWSVVMFGDEAGCLALTGQGFHIRDTGNAT